MEQNIFIALANNAALLLGLSVTYEISYLIPSKYRRFRSIVSGILISLICITIMSIPFVFIPGVIYDTRSILISVTALTFGPISTIITVVAAIIFRVAISGGGSAAGISVIITSALLGLIWRRWVTPNSGMKRWLRIYLMSIVVHIFLLLSQLAFLQYPNNLAVIREIALPVLLIYPITSLLLSLLLLRQQERRSVQEQLEDSEERFQLLFNQAPLGYQSLDIDGNIIDVNQKWLDTFGYSRREVIGRWFGDFISPSYKEKFSEKFSLFKEQGHMHCEYEMLQKNGKNLFISFEGKIGKDYEGEFKQTHCILQDVTEQKKAEDALFESESKYSNYIESAPDGVLVVDETGRYIEVNKAVSKITGYSKEELLNMKIGDLSDDEFREDVLMSFEELRNTGSSSATLKYKRKDGLRRWWILNSVKISDNRFLIFASDITDRKEAEDSLFYLIYHDYLTGLFNRKYFDEAIIRLDKDKFLPLSIIIADINGVRLINDAFGYAEGDNLLRDTSKILKNCCHPSDILARVGGDDFAILMPNTNYDEAYERLSGIINAFEEYNKSKKNRLYEINLSVGFATKSNSNEIIAETVKAADDYLRTKKLLNSKSYHNALITSMLTTVYEKSEETEEHSRRIADLCMQIGEKLKLSQKSLGELELFSMLHDIGKVVIDDGILKKPGKLTDEEWVIMKTHSEVGYRITKSSADLETISEYILTHHERWNGSGYPNGLSGEDIPLLSRILAVSDAYDAMTEDRVYRKKMSDEEAIKEIQINSGTQFDPQVVKAFEKIIADKL